MPSNLWCGVSLCYCSLHPLLCSGIGACLVVGLPRSLKKSLSLQKRPLELELRPLTWKLRAGDSQLAAHAAPQPHSSGHPAALPASGVPSGNSRLHPSAAFAQVHAFERSQQQSQQHQEQQPAGRILSVKAGVQVAGSGQTLGMDIRTTEGRLQPSSPAAASSSAASTATEATRALRKVKDAMFDKKLYVSVFADGPTRVLCFSDTPMAGTSAADDGGSEQLMGRLHQVTRQLMQIDGQLQLSLGPSCALRTARGSTAVPAALLLQQQQRAAALSKQDVQVPPQLNAAAGAWHSSSTTAAAVVLLQQLGLHPLAGQVAWPLQATAGAIMPAPPCRQLVEAETSQASVKSRCHPSSLVLHTVDVTYFTDQVLPTELVMCWVLI